jgi:hypothetical protein
MANMTVQDAINDLSVVANPQVTELRIASGGVVVAAGDFTGGLTEDLFTLTAHGLADNERIRLLYESAAGVVTGAVGDIFYVDRVDADTFHISLTAGGAAVENTADGTAVFMREDAAFSLANATSGGIDEDDAGYVTFG